MWFSVVYSVDVPQGSHILDWAPPELDLWDETQGDDCFEYRYLGGAWEKGSHRQWAAWLDRLQFDRFVQHCGLYAEDIETLGTIGAPGLGYGCSPAISFVGRDSEAIVSAYVTPVPQTRRHQLGEGDWLRIRDAILSVYGR